MTPFRLSHWMEILQPDSGIDELVLLQERDGQRTAVEKALEETVTDHLAGLEVVRRIGGYKRTLAFIRNKLPSDKRVRSGDFGEILASEYIAQCTEYRVPIKRLRWKDDRNTTMRGTDVIGIRKAKKRWCLLKAESKSRAKLSKGVVQEAVDGLDKHAGRPNPSSLAFISARLREQKCDEEAAVFEELQSRTPEFSEIEHLVFTVSANDPGEHLKKHLADLPIKRFLVGCVIADHQRFIAALFDRIYAGNRRRNRRPD